MTEPFSPDVDAMTEVEGASVDAEALVMEFWAEALEGDILDADEAEDDVWGDADVAVLEEEAATEEEPPRAAAEFDPPRELSASPWPSKTV